MRRLALPILVSIALVGLCGLTSCAKGQFCAPGSFLAAKVDSVDALVKQVTSNPSVAKRYANHYGVSPDKVAAYFRANLKVVTLQKPLKTTVYFVGQKSGKIRSKTKIIPAGSKIFVGPNNTPLVDMKCGNPLHRNFVPPPPAPIKTSEKPHVEEYRPTQEAFVPPAPPVQHVPPAVHQEAPPVAPHVSPLPVVAPALPLAAKLAAPALLAVGSVHKSGGSAVPEPGAVLAALSILIPAGVIFRRRKS